MVELKCQHCGNQYSVSPYQAKISKYCSRSCLALAARVRVEADCAICGKHFEHISSRSNKAKYCSRTCYYKSLKLKGSVTVKCAHCDKPFLCSPSQNRKYCSRACVSKSHHAVFEPTFCTVRKAMVKRNLLQCCERCGYADQPRILGVHHKDRDRENNKRSNLEVLCPNCHSLEHLKHIAHGFQE